MDRAAPPTSRNGYPFSSGGAGHLLEGASCDQKIRLAPPVAGSKGTKERFSGRRPGASPGPSMPAWEPKWCEWQRRRSLLDVIGKPWTSSDLPSHLSKLVLPIPCMFSRCRALTRHFRASMERLFMTPVVILFLRPSRTFRNSSDVLTQRSVWIDHSSASPVLFVGITAIPPRHNPYGQPMYVRDERESRPGQAGPGRTHALVRLHSVWRRRRVGSIHRNNRGVHAVQHVRNATINLSQGLEPQGGGALGIERASEPPSGPSDGQ
jgi:hypothetical protein